MNSISILTKLTGQKIILPFYHSVSNNAPIHLKHLYNVRSVNTFIQDIEYLLQNYNPISIDELYDHVTGNQLINKPSFLISFDDGLSEFKDHAWPVLKQKGIPAALFINPKFVGNAELFFRFKASILIDFIRGNTNEKLINEARTIFSSLISTVASFEEYIAKVKYEQKNVLSDIAEFFNIDFMQYLQTAKPYLSLNDLQTLQNEGVHIGAHSMDHALFCNLNNDEKANQLFESTQWVQSNLNQSINTFSYPFTDFGVSAEFFNKVFSNEQPKVHLSFGTAGIKKEKFSRHLQRIPVEDYSCNMQQILKHQYLYYLAKAPLFKNTIRR